MIRKNWQKPKTYAAKHGNEDVRAVSRSGGVFTAVSDLVLSDGGVVYGCVLTDNFKAVHTRAEDNTKRNLMRGSKYVQSKLGDTFRNVKKDLDNGRKVFFSGTSCQVAGLMKFLGKEYKNLICVDIVCHGVPSPLVWEVYLKWQEKKIGAKVASVDFRNKADFGWHAHMETLTMDNGKRVSSGIFKELFYGHNVLRPSCYECPFKSVMHPGDITIADYWGIEKAAPELDDNKGVSLVLVNNDMGAEILDNIKDNLVLEKTKIEDSMQPPLKAPFPKPESREQFWTDFANMDFCYIAKKYCGYGFVNTVKGKARNLKHKMVRLIGQIRNLK